MELTKKNYKRMVIDAAHKLIPPVLFLMALLAAIMCMTVLLGCSNDEGVNPQPSGTNGTGDLMGSVKDENGNPYPNTLIRLSGNSASFETKTDSNGDFGFDKKDVGLYTIALTLPLSTELLPGSSSNVNIQADQAAMADFVIRPLPLEAVLNYGAADIFDEIRDKNGNTPSGPNEPLYAANFFEDPIGLLTAIKAPDGHHVTLSEYQQAKGTFKVHCNGETSTVEIALEGMIPNGTYTVWLGFLNKIITVGDPISPADFVHPVNPPLGASNGSENVLIAGADGTIDVMIEHASCILTDQVALGVPVSYHINGNTYGAGVIPDPEEVTQLLVFFQ